MNETIKATLAASFKLLRLLYALRFFRNTGVHTESTFP
jgi:hypothetical protein